MTLYIYAAFCLRSCAAPLVRGVMEQEADRAKLDVSDLGVLLEKEEAIRTHLRDSENVLFAGETKESVKVACTAHINVLLRVVLTKVVETEGMPQPPIHPLRDQLELLYHKCGRVSVDTDQIIRDSWYVRKFVGLVKMKTRKEKVSEEPSLEFRNAYNLYLICPFPCKWQYILWFGIGWCFHGNLTAIYRNHPYLVLDLAFRSGERLSEIVFDPQPRTEGPGVCIQVWFEDQGSVVNQSMLTIYIRPHDHTMGLLKDWCCSSWYGREYPFT